MSGEETGAQEKAALMTTRAIAMNIEAGLDTLFEKRTPSDHSQSNWASEIHHPCLLNLVYCRARWRERQPMDLDGEYRTETGKEEERKLLRKIELAGYDIEQQQDSFEWPEYKIVCKIDAMLRIGKGAFPLEVKSVNPNYWPTLKTIGDIKSSRHWWIQKITAQLNLEIFMTKREAGFLVIGTYGKRPRILPMLPDRDLKDIDTMKARQVNEHVEKGTLPAPMPYDRVVCQMCDFNHICPVVKELGPSWVEIPPAETIKLNWYLELKEQRRLFNEIHGDLVGDMEKPGKYFGKNALMDDIQITSETRPRRKYKVPKEIRDEYAEEYELTTTTIERIEP